MASILRIRTTWTGAQGVPYLSTHYFTRVDSGSAAFAADAVAALWTGMEDYISNTLDWTVEGFAAVINDATGDLVGVDAVGGGNSGSGTQGSTTLPYATQGLLGLTTSNVVSGRILRGRCFIPGPTEEHSSEGVPTSGYISALSAAAGDMLASPDAELLIWSRAHGTSHPVTSYNPWAQWAVLRSRRD